MAGNNERTVAGDIAVAYLKKYPKASTRALARMMYKENSLVWTSEEAARSAIRRYRGANGKLSRKNIVTTEHYQAVKDREPVLPSSDAKDYKPYYLPNGRWLVVADTHIPYHRPEPIKAAVDWAVKHGYTDGLLMNGDIQDCYSLSRWNKNPRARDFAGEREMVGEVLDYFERRLKPKRKVWKLGNHEERLERYLAVKAPELFGCQEFRFQTC